MRANARNAELTVRAIAGTHVVLLGLNVNDHPSSREGGDLSRSFEELTLGSPRKDDDNEMRPAVAASKSKMRKTSSAAPSSGGGGAKKNKAAAASPGDNGDGKHHCFVGFSIQRRDVTTGKMTSLNWNGRPIQKFHWGDYGVLPGRAYVYVVGRLSVSSSSKGRRGTARGMAVSKQAGAPPSNFSGLVQYGSSIEVRVTTEDPEKGTHGVYFNRGTAGSSAFSERFARFKRYKSVEKFGYRSIKPIIDPRTVPNGEALAWLSRGLETALEKFLRRATGPRWSLRAAVYEFTHPGTIQAFAAAVERGADVKILRHCRGTNRAKVRRDEIVLDEDGKVIREWIPDDVTDAATKAIRSIGLKDRVSAEKWERDTFIMRRNGSSIMHNKFIILANKKGAGGIEAGDLEPLEVWTGSTNFTDGGIYGQSNVGHIVRDVNVAKTYLTYWAHLSTDPPGRSHARKSSSGFIIEPMDDFIEDLQPDLERPIASPPNPSIRVIFSPRKTIGMLQWYADRMNEAKNSMMFTAAFGVSQPIAEVLNGCPPHSLSTARRSNRIAKLTGTSVSSCGAGDQESGGSVLRYILLDTKPSKQSSDKSHASATKKGVAFVDYYDFKDVPANRIAYGTVLEDHGNVKRHDDNHVKSDEEGDGKEGIFRHTSENLTGLTTFVDYVHTKFMLIDPFSTTPILVTGSANFSAASTDKNDENMLVIQGETSAADVYLTEFLRLFDHFRARDDWKEGIKEERKEGWDEFVADDSWLIPFFDTSTQLYKERMLFC